MSPWLWSYTCTSTGNHWAAGTTRKPGGARRSGAVRSSRSPRSYWTHRGTGKSGTIEGYEKAALPSRCICYHEIT